MTSVLLMWVDPICLDMSHTPQDPLESLTSQKAIYDNVSRVLIWLGEPREATSVWFSAVEQFSGRGEVRNISKYDLELEFGNSFLSKLKAWTQPLFRLPWWHWGRVEALLALEDPSKVAFCCGSERMSWETFTSVVYFLRYVLPRLEVDYSLWLDQILLQIPGRLPKAFREIFHREIVAAGAQEEDRWGEGILFAHPQDVHYDMKNTSESAAAGRLMTRLSARLANRYRRRCKLNLIERYNNGSSSRDRKIPTRTLAREDEALDRWLRLLGSLYSNHNPLANAAVSRAIAALETSRPPSTADMATGYTPLNADDREIRILVLYPDQYDGADIVCDLFNFNVREFSDMGAERFPYLALSYVWGKREPAKTIWLCGEKREITPNLFEALQGLRDPFVPMLLWVDALCIDQSNADEVSSQVSMMDIIYSGAGAVLAWISSQQRDNFLTTTAINLLMKLENLIDDALYDIGQPSSKQPLWDEWVGHLTSGYGPLQAFDDLFQSPYFNRVWTIQEVFLSRNVIICHSGAAIYFRTLLFKAAQHGRWAIPQPMDTGYSGVANVHVENFLSSYYSMLRGQPPTVLEGLLLARDRCVTVKHDSIYGILGLLDRSGTQHLSRPDSAWQIPDYSEDYYNVCLKVSMQILSDTKNLDILSACEVRRHHEEDPTSTVPGGNSWPSWLPDWSVRPIHPGWARSVLSTANPVTTSTTYDACGGNEAWHRINTTGSNQHVLHLRGAVVDAIENACDRNWDPFEVDRWIGWISPNEKVSMPQFLCQPALRPRYATEDDVRLALSQMLNFGHEGLEGLLSEKGRRDPQIPDLQAVQRALVNAHACRSYPSRLFISVKGYLARGPRGVQKGDKIVIFQGAKVPFVIRPVDGPEAYFSLVGECYLHQAMYGQAFGGLSLPTDEEFALI